MDVEEDRNGNLWAWWLPPGWTGDPTKRVRHRLASGFGARRRSVRRTARRRVGLRGDRHRPRPWRGADDSRCRRRVLRRGGRAVRRRVRGIAARHRRTERRTGPRAARQRRRHARRGTDPRGPQPRAPRRRRRPAEADRGLRRAARRAGPRTRSRRPPDRGGLGDLAARPLGVHLRRCGEPCGHDASGRSTRPDAGVRVVGALRALGGHPARGGRHVRQGSRLTQRRQRDTVADPGLARRPRRRRGDADGAGRADQRRRRRATRRRTASTCR